MNELIKIRFNTNQEPTVSGRELHRVLEIKTKYSDWFKRMLEYGFTENIDYVLVTQKRETNNPKNPYTEIIDHDINFDMGKEIAMLQRNEQGKVVRQYFIQVEKEYNSPEKVMARALLLANNEIQKLTLTVNEMKPKAEFYDTVAESKDAIPMNEVAKVLNYKGYGRNRLFEFLRNNNVLMSNNLPYQTYIDKGYFRVIEQKFSKPNGDVTIYIKTLVYQKGIDFIKRLLDSKG